MGKASGRAITAALDELYPKALDIKIIDIWTDHGKWPFNTFVRSYQYLAKRPFLWKLMYEYANFPPTRCFSQRWAAVTCWRNFEMLLQEEAPDMIISVHPLCQTLPLRVANKMQGGLENRQKKLPFVTVVMDLSRCHDTWFDKNADRTYVPSDVTASLARRKKIPEEKLRQVGLPIGPTFRSRDVKEKKVLRGRLGLDKRARTALVV